MTAKSETKITTDIIEWIKRQGGDAYHVHGGMFQRSGEPDIAGEIPIPFGWMHLHWEVKTPIGKPSKLQLLRLDRYSKRDYSVGIVTSIDECKLLLEEYIKFGNNLQSWEKTHELYTSGTKTTR